MAQAKVIAAALALALVSCAPRYSWEAVNMDGSRTGVTAPTASTVKEALGSIDANGAYTAPNGRVFDCGSTPVVACALISAQPAMAHLKEWIGYTDVDLKARRPESALSNLICDLLMKDVAAITGKKVDISVQNFGGIRTSVAKGDILKEDIVSMLPFKNYLCYVRLSGENVRILIEKMLETKMGLQAMGGVKVTITDGKVESILVGGEPLDPARDYGVATIDFLLDGGDDIAVARNATELTITDELMVNSLLNYIEECTAAGKHVNYATDGRVVIKNTEEGK